MEGEDDVKPEGDMRSELAELQMQANAVTDEVRQDIFVNLVVSLCKFSSFIS